MKHLIRTTVIIFLFLGCRKELREGAKKGSHHHRVEKKKTPKKTVLSPHAHAMAMIGEAHIHIDYSSPSVRGRMIFGGLLAYDEVWQSGAHNATWLETNKDLLIDGEILEAGKYGLFTIPSRGDWTVIFNTNWNQHGKDAYDKKEDALRFKVTPKFLQGLTEHLKYEVKKSSNTHGTISLSWEQVAILFPFEVK